jgi:PAS domain S-box-containing protein
MQTPEHTTVSKSKWRPVQDPVIYPGLYSATGFDMMAILVRHTHTHALFPVPSSLTSHLSATTHSKRRLAVLLTVISQLQVIARPNPKVELGPVDCSVALVLCDLELPDCPIVYASESFCELTGYSQPEILGRNCRFLQAPRGKNPATYTVAAADKIARQRMHHAVATQDEVQLEVTNYKRNGQPFTNILTIIPVAPTPTGYRYAVGFQVESE